MRCVQLMILLALSCTFCISTSCQEQRQIQQRHPTRYLIPDGYVGWVQINFKVDGAPPLPIEDAYYVVKFPSSGLIQTSSNIEYGVAVDEFFYYSDNTRRQIKESGWGEGGMIWGAYNGKKTDGTGRLIKSYEGFFVGTEEEFNRYGGIKDSSGDPKIGPINTVSQ